MILNLTCDRYACDITCILPLITVDNEIDVAIGSPLTIIMRKVKEISTQLANQLKKSLIELPNSSVSLRTARSMAERCRAFYFSAPSLFEYVLYFVATSSI